MDHLHGRCRKVCSLMEQVSGAGGYKTGNPSHYLHHSFTNLLFLTTYTFTCGTLIIGASRWLSGKESACSAGDVRNLSSIPWSGKSPGGGHGNPHSSCLENPMDRGAWRAVVHRVAKSWTRLKQLSMYACMHFYY